MRNLLIVFCFIAASNLVAQPGKQTFDTKLVGTWNGSEKDQQQTGLEKHWVMHRFGDGTFILLFTIVQDGEVSSHAEKGKWWVQDNEFHELHFESGLTDIYAYTFLDDYHVRFKSRVIIESTQEHYEFVDTKLVDN